MLVMAVITGFMILVESSNHQSPTSMMVYSTFFLLKNSKAIKVHNSKKEKGSHKAKIILKISINSCFSICHFSVKNLSLKSRRCGLAKTQIFL